MVISGEETLDGRDKGISLFIIFFVLFDSLSYITWYFLITEVIFFFYRYKNVKSKFKWPPDLPSLSGSLSAFSLCGH